SHFACWWLPGGPEYVLARARLVDDLTTARAREGLDQLVLLGAGFDTTAYRLDKDLPGVRLFEGDHPATQAVKGSAAARLGVPRNVQFVAVDFERDDVAKQLIDAGFDPSLRSLVTWLGVSYYLTEEAVARILHQTARLCAPGGSLVFDYADASVI